MKRRGAEHAQLLQTFFFDRLFNLVSMTTACERDDLDFGVSLMRLWK